MANEGNILIPGKLDHEVTSFHKTALEHLRPNRVSMLRNCHENFLFYLGQHWTRFDPGLRAFRMINTAQQTPRPVVNLFKAKIGDIIAMLASIDPDLTMAPATDQETDRITADMGKAVLGYLGREMRLDDRRLELAYTVGILNNAYGIVDYDPDGGQPSYVARWVCPTHDGEAESMDAQEAVKNQMRCPEDGSPLEQHASDTDQVNQGQFNLSIKTPFEVWVDYSIQDDDEQPVIIVREMRTMEWLRERYGNKVTETMETTEAGSIGDLGLTYLHNVIRLAPVTGIIVGGHMRFENAAIVDTLYALPTKKFPKGLWARLTSKGEVLESKRKLPFHTGTDEKPGRQFIPFVHFGYDYVPRAHLCIGPSNDLKSPQRDYNRLLAHVKMYFSRSANGVWWLPEGVRVGQVTGVEGLVLRGNPTATQGGEPKRIEGATLPNSFQERFDQIEKEMETITGLKDPAEQLPRLDSGYAIQLLDQQRQRRLSPVFRNYAAKYRRLGEIMFHVFRNFAPEEAYYKVKGERAEFAVKRLEAADMNGGIEVMVEQGSEQPRTLMQKQGALERMISYGAVDTQDPTTKLQIGRLLGSTDFLPDIDADDQKIAREHAATIQWAEQNFDPNTGAPLPGIDPRTLSNFPILIDPDLDDHALHAARDRLWMLSEAFTALPPAVQQAYRYVHFKAHVMMVQQQQEQQAAQQEQAQPGQKGQQNQQGRPKQTPPSPGSSRPAGGKGKPPQSAADTMSAGGQPPNS